MMLKEILLSIGVIRRNNDNTITLKGNKILDVYPIILEDDGIGYGVHPRYVSCAEQKTYYDKNLHENVFNVFVAEKYKNEKYNGTNISCKTV